jgi:hypothetical protein
VVENRSRLPAAVLFPEAMMDLLIRSLEAEYLRYKALAEGALAQVSDAALGVPGPNDGNSLATICWHVAGNLESRFTDLLTTDGEKPWREREAEFAVRAPTRAELLARWNTGWSALLGTLRTLNDGHLTATVTIRSQSLAVHEALHRSLAHVSYHVGQIVYLSHAMVGDGWHYLSIAPGGTAAYNANPTKEKPVAAIESITSGSGC